jgi:hypothetical protein
LSVRIKVKGTQAMRSDLSGLRSGQSVQLVRERDNLVDRYAVLVLRADADWHEVWVLMRQRPDIGEGLKGSGLTRDELLARVRAFAWRVPGVIGYLPFGSGRRFGPERFTARIAGVPRFGGTPGVDLYIEPKQVQQVTTGARERAGEPRMGAAA